MSPQQSPAVALAGVTLAYGPVAVIEDLSLALAAGQTHCLLGPSGSGKSTLLRALTGLAPAIRGEVRVLGRRVEPAATGAQREANRSTGLVLQEGGLFPHLSVRDNAVLPAVLVEWLARPDRAALDGARGAGGSRRPTSETGTPAR